MVKTVIDEVYKGFYVLRLNDNETKYFEALWYIPEGITYNAYVLVSDERIVLFDTWKYTYVNEFLETLSRIVNPKDIDYIVVHHTEPDHSGALPEVLKTNRYKAKVLGHPLAKEMLEAFYNIKPVFKPLKDGEELVIGSKRLKFIFTPWLHWPETIMTYIVDDMTLLSGDAFGGFSIPHRIYDDNIEAVSKYMSFARKYVASIIGYYRSFVIKNIEKLSKLGIKLKIIAPLHGLIWRNKPETIVNQYLKWAKAEATKKKAVIIYSSMYRFVEKAILAAKNELHKNGYNVIVFKFTDSHYDNLSNVLGDVLDAEVLIIGSATYEASIFPYMELIVNLLSRKISSKKKTLIVSAYGWSGVAARRIAELLSKASFQIVDIIEFNGLPEDSVLEKIRNSLRKLI